EVRDVALVEDVVPTADVVDRDLDVFAVGAHRRAIPEDVVGDAAALAVEDRVGDALPLGPAEHVLLLQYAAHVAVAHQVGGRDHHVGGLQMRRGGHGGLVGGDAHGRAAGEPDLAVAPGLGRGPFDAVVAVLHVVLEGRVEALGAALAAHVLQHED